MTILSRVLKLVLLGTALIALAGCRPIHVHESYRETYVPSHYYGAPSPAVFVPRVVVPAPRIIYSTEHHSHHRHSYNHDRRDRNNHGRNQRRDHWDGR